MDCSDALGNSHLKIGSMIDEVFEEEKPPEEATEMKAIHVRSGRYLLMVERILGSITALRRLIPLR
jgi:hypothetical protein